MKVIINTFENMVKWVRDCVLLVMPITLLYLTEVLKTKVHVSEEPSSEAQAEEALLKLNPSVRILLGTVGVG